jgi:hypothetical protein
VTPGRRALLLALLLATAAGCGSGSLTPAQRLHAAVKAAQATFDPDSAGGTGYGTTARLVRRMGSGPYGTPLPFPDDFAFRPGVVYAGILGTDTRQAILWEVDASGRAFVALLRGPHKARYETRSRADGIRNGMTVIRPGVLSGGMVRSALERAGFAHIQLALLPRMADGDVAVVFGHTDEAAAEGGFVEFAVFRTAAEARRQEAQARPISRRARSVVVGSVWIGYSWKANARDRSRAFMEAVARLRRELRTE